MDSLKKAWTSSPILAFADFSENAGRFNHDCDYSACHHVIGSVLTQASRLGQRVGTYVEVDMYGLPTDTIRKEFRTNCRSKYTLELNDKI